MFEYSNAVVLEKLYKFMFEYSNAVILEKLYTNSKLLNETN